MLRNEGYTYKYISQYLNDSDMLSISGRRFSPQLIERTLFKYYKSQVKYKNYRRTIEVIV